MLYRFMWLRSFHDPVAVTLIAMPDGSGQLRLRVADQLRRLTVDSTQSVAPEQVASLFALVDQSEYWQMPTQIPTRGLDGSEWILEAVKNGNYHIVDRWCAGKTAFGKAAFTMVLLSRYKLSDGEVY